ncbi:hypothetical protein EOD39_10985 [Acipenser ruthenus]|uniref:Uncharacterized protein n=1 Tax=Acipenser ruthenus TaxID=7906 RepID=A0A662YSU6_ACIRT|nr:hypothetical protein EOD39_10985 [Acipenser ruthenus]
MNVRIGTVLESLSSSDPQPPVTQMFYGYIVTVIINLLVCSTPVETEQEEGKKELRWREREGGSALESQRRKERDRDRERKREMESDMRYRNGMKPTSCIQEQTLAGFLSDYFTENNAFPTASSTAASSTALCTLIPQSHSA